MLKNQLSLPEGETSDTSSDLCPFPSQELDQGKPKPFMGLWVVVLSGQP